MNTETLPVAIIGGGPVGLAAAAQLTQRGQAFQLFEAGEQLGANFLDYGHVRLFSTWEYNVDDAAKALLLKHGVELPESGNLPLGKEIATDYLQPLGELPEMKPFIHLGSKVIHISRKGLSKVKTAGREEVPFELLVESPETGLKKFQARAVIDATGTWHNPNPLISGGLPSTESNSIHTGLPDLLGSDRSHFENKRIAVIGSGHSAFNTILDLSEIQKLAPQTAITWIIRRPNLASILGGGSADQLAERGALGTRVHRAVQERSIDMRTSCVIDDYAEGENGAITLYVTENGIEQELGPFDEIIANTGSHPNFDFLREIRYSADPALESVPELAPLIDPNVHSCGTVRPHGEKELRQPEKDFYIIGAKSYGRAPTFLMATGYEQARSVAAHLAGDYESAKRIELNLPETGVCSSRPLILQKAGTSTACC
ncbi:MAG TPA: NAD(P)-binding domain-containing protein [Planococcus sp. (in: firmicutes)]|nr:NAD(P)-binding domain-containing protein [Planococcus sp. (in: firmicutes)]